MATSNSRDSGESPRKVRAEIRKARAAQNRFEHARLQAASEGGNPDETPRVRERHLALHTAVMNAYREIRGYVSRQLPEYWSGTQRQDAPVIYEANDFGRIVGLKELDDFQGAVTMREITSHERHNGGETKKQAVPHLLPPEACQRALNLIDECAVELGIAEEINERKVITEVPRDGL